MSEILRIARSFSSVVSFYQAVFKKRCTNNTNNTNGKVKWKYGKTYKKLNVYKDDMLVFHKCDISSKDILRTFWWYCFLDLVFLSLGSNTSTYNLS